MIINKLKSWNYYKEKIPLYIQNSYGIVEHFKILFDLLVQMDLTEDDVLYGFNILDASYLTFINNLDDSDTKDRSDILNKIGLLYGVTRTFDVDYIENNETKTASLHLTNSEFLKLIKARIIQNNYDGSYIQSREFYDKMNLPVYLFQSANSAEVYVYLNTSVPLTENEEKMFLANLFTIKSMGITYITSITEVVSLLIWDSTSEFRYWDKGRWTL